MLCIVQLQRLACSQEVREREGSLVHSSLGTKMFPQRCKVDPPRCSRIRVRASIADNIMKKGVGYKNKRMTTICGSFPQRQQCDEDGDGVTAKVWVLRKHLFDPLGVARSLTLKNSTCSFHWQTISYKKEHSFLS